MNARHISPTLALVPYHYPQQLPRLRLKRMMIIALLRYCSILILSAFLLITIALCYLCNIIGFMSLTNAFLFFLTVLFLALLWVQNRYSERRTERLNICFTDSICTIDQIKNMRSYLVILSLLNYLTFLWLAGAVIHQHVVPMLFSTVMGTAIYIIALCMIRKLLKAKAVLKRTICNINDWHCAF
jgi:hypothetical protein